MRNIIYLLIILSLPSLAQQWQWDSLIGKSAKIKFFQDANHNLYTFEYRGHNIAKYDANRNLLWTKNMDGVDIFRLNVDKNSGIYITGEFQNSTMVDGHAITNLGKSDVFFAKLDAYSGSLMMIKTIGSAEDDFAGDISAGQDLIVSCTVGDNAYVAGSYFPKTKNMDLALARFDLQGNFIDCRMSEFVGQQPISEEGAYAIEHECDAAGNIFLIAGVNGQVRIDGYELKDVDASYLIKFSPRLRLQYFRRVENDTYTDISNLSLDAAGNIYCSQNFLYEFGASTALLQFNSDGQLKAQYTPPFNCNMHQAISTSEGHLLFSGIRIRWSISDNMASQYYMVNGELSNEFRLIWLKQDSSAYYISGSDICQLKENTFLVSGTFSNSVALKNTYNSASFAQFLAIYNSGRDSLTEGVKENLSSAAQVRICPNPSSGKFFVNGFPDSTEIKVYDPYGKCLYCAKSNEIDLSTQAKGMYFLEGKSKEGIVRKKLIVE
jgi:hypothetical protein